MVVNNNCLQQGFICTKTDLGYHHTCTAELKDIHEIHMAAHGWSIFQWGNYTIPALKAKWKELLVINQMHGERCQESKDYCLGCSPQLMDLAIRMINHHLDRLCKVRTQETAPHRIHFKNGYPVFEFRDRLPEDEFECNLAGWGNAQKLDFKALPWNNKRHDKVSIIPIDTVFNYNTLVVINNWVAQFMWSHMINGYCNNCNSDKDKEIL